MMPLLIKKLITASKWILVLSAIESIALGMPQDSQQPVQIKANSAKIDKKTGVNIFEGDVVIDQGSTHLTGDKVYVINNKEKKVTEIISFGNPQKLAHYDTLPASDQTRFDAWALTIKYFPIKGLALLIKEAFAEQKPNTFRGPLISYNVKSQVVTSLPSSEGQTTIVLHPNNLPTG